MIGSLNDSFLLHFLSLFLFLFFPWEISFFLSFLTCFLSEISFSLSFLTSCLILSFSPSPYHCFTHLMISSDLSFHSSVILASLAEVSFLSSFYSLSRTVLSFLILWPDLFSWSHMQSRWLHLKPRRLKPQRPKEPPRRKPLPGRTLGYEWKVFFGYSPLLHIRGCGNPFITEKKSSFTFVFQNDFTFLNPFKISVKSIVSICVEKKGGVRWGLDACLISNHGN